MEKAQYLVFAHDATGSVHVTTTHDYYRARTIARDYAHDNKAAEVTVNQNVNGMPGYAYYICAWDAKRRHVIGVS
jgi:hypothetical protein